MKTIKKIVLMTALALAAVPAVADDEMSNQEASALYSKKIDIVKSEIVTLKKKHKLDPADEHVSIDLQGKQVELETLKQKKSIVDAAIKAEKEQEKKDKAAQKAVKNADKAAASAESATKRAETAVERAQSVIDENLSLENASDLYDSKLDILKSEVRILRKRKKLEPENVIELDTSITNKMAEINELKTKKKIVDDAIKAEKQQAKATKASEKADKNSAKAADKAKDAQRDAQKAQRKAESIK